MRVTGFGDIPDGMLGGVVAIGNFDGVHRGHQLVIDRALGSRTNKTQPVIAMTFEPHPRTVFKPDEPVARLTDAAMKSTILQCAGASGVLEVPFSREFSKQTADQFVDDILIGALQAKHVVTGFDFHFGVNRQGGPAFLMEAGKKHGFDVSLVDAERDKTFEVISSSRIRDALTAGDLGLANSLFGYKFRVSAEVIHGKQLGRTLGFPTANMVLEETMPLAHGVYAVMVHGADETPLPGIANFGRRPTVDVAGGPLLETHIFDRTIDLYDRTFEVSFHAFIRGEQKFSGIDALKEQMDKDAAKAREILSGTTDFSALDEKLNAAALSE
ncbi:MAG: bifunctional riboflavin kinase/FAD synthetase [Pseudomonadota bacterium]